LSHNSYDVSKRKNIIAEPKELIKSSETMSPMDLLVNALLGMFVLVVANIGVWLISRNAKKASHVKKGQTVFLALSVIAYIIFLILFVYITMYSNLRI
jgi:hypothetical protein